jgi:hypothetical protein
MFPIPPRQNSSVEGFSVRLTPIFSVLRKSGKRGHARLGAGPAGAHASRIRAVSGESASPTDLLIAWGQGEREACDRLMPLVYDELRRLASRCMRRERPGHTLQATALVNEVYLRLVDVKRVHVHSRAHFFALAARMMRRLLVDSARARGAGKRRARSPGIAG